MFEELQLQLIESFTARLQKLPPRRDNQFIVSGNNTQFQIKNLAGQLILYQVTVEGKVFRLVEQRLGKINDLGTFKNEAKLVKFLEKQNLK